MIRALVLVCCLGLLAACGGTPGACKVEDAGTVTARYAARMRIQCTGYSFDDCPSRPAIEDARRAELENLCPTH